MNLVSISTRGMPAMPMTCSGSKRVNTVVGISGKASLASCTTLMPPHGLSADRPAAPLPGVVAGMALIGLRR